MRIKYSKITEGNFIRKEIKYKSIFDGIVNYIKFDSTIKPSYVNNKIFSNMCIKNNNYFWLELFPKDDNYIITIMFDDHSNIIQWYIDISKSVCIDSDVPYQDDLYLDIVITPDGKKYILDIDELEEALSRGIISKKEYDFAFVVLKKVEKKYGDNFGNLLHLTNFIYNEFKK